MTTLAHGSWPSPLSAQAVVAAGVGLGGPLVAEDGSVWWSEARPQEGGRIQLVRRTPGGAVEEVLPEGWSARTRVHEYGGGAWWLHGTSVFFSSWADHRLHRLDVDPWGHGTGIGVELAAEAPAPADLSPATPSDGSEGNPDQVPPTPVALTPVPELEAADRYADGAVTEDGAWVLCVRERHRADGGEPANEIVAVRTGPGPEGPVEPVVVVTGHDFVSNPRIDPTGRWICWLAWDHPRMPWDGTELWVAELLVDPDPGVAPRLVDARRVLGGPEVSVAQPSWTPDGTLVAVADLDGWWNLWSAPSPGLPELGTFTQVSTVEGELAQPQWVFGQSWYGHLPDGTVVGSWRFDGTDHLGVLDPGERVPRWLDLGTTSTIGLHVGADGQVAVVAASFTSEAQVALIHLGNGEPRRAVASGDLAEGVEQRPPTEHPVPAADLDPPDDEVGPGGAHEHLEVIRRPRELDVDASWWSVPSTITFPTTGEREAHALWYPPHNPEVGEAEGSAPPVLVLGHGGPTSAARPHLDLAIQYWTTRGWGVVDVNYGGSTGYGRPYRRQLDGQWGVVDVDDLCAAAEHLVSRGLADPSRLAIKGGSAGGFTVLAALAFRDTFSAGASRYGIADLEALARDTHKFESRYTDGLVAPYPEGRDLYLERSPIHHLDGFDKPLLVLQGLLDEVVPPNQAEMIVEALEAKGVPVAYVEFPEEAHGFRSADAILTALLAEHYFLSEVLGIEPADELPEIPIRRPGDGLGEVPS